jgi:hypothetical protein
MPFPPSSNKKMNFLHALKGDQAKGLPPVAGPMATPMAGGMKPPMAPPTVNPMINPIMNPKPMAIPHIPQAPAPNFKPPMSQPMGNPNVPALGGQAKLPKFNKMRNSLKGGPFKKQ